MKRRLTQIVGSVVLGGAIIGTSQIAFAQGELNKQARKDAAWQANIGRDYAKLDRWLERQESKRMKDQATQERKFGSLPLATVP